MEQLHKGKHLIILLAKEDWVGIEISKEIHATVEDYKKINAHYTKDDLLVIAEQILVDAGATLVSYNTLYIPC